MEEHTNYNRRWKMEEIVPYLVKIHFKNQATSNKDLSEAFWKLMGQNIEMGGTRRWTTGETGVPYQIDRLIEKHILAQVSPGPNPIPALDYPEFGNFYVLGDKGEEYVSQFISKYSKEVIDQEIEKYLGEK